MRKMKWVLGCMVMLLPLCIGIVPLRAERELTPDGFKIYTDEDYYGVTERWDYTEYVTEQGVPSTYGNAVDGYRHTEGLEGSYAWAPCNSTLTCYTGEGQQAGLSLSGEPYCYRGEDTEKAVVFRADESHPWKEGAGVQLQLPGMESGFRLFSIEIGVRGNAPRSWKLQYSADDGATWEDFGPGATAVEEDGAIQWGFRRVRLPSSRSYEEILECLDHNTLWGEPYDASKDLFRMRVVAVEDGSGWVGSTSGEVCVKQVRLEQSAMVPSDGVLLYRLPDCQVTVSQPLIYNGQEQKPAVFVKDWEQDRVLQEGKDYTVEYRDNIDAGTGVAVITGTGDYYKSVTKEFTIQKNVQKLTGNKKYKKSYGAKAFRMDVKTNAKGAQLKYVSSNKKVVTVDKNGKVSIQGTGSATVTVKAAETANYKGKSLKVTVNVSPKKQTVKSVKAKGGKITVRWKKDARATGYQVQYSTDKGFRKGVHTIQVKGNKTVSKVISKIRKGRNYYVRVRSYKDVKINGGMQKLYGAYSAKEKVKIKK